MKKNISLFLMFAGLLLTTACGSSDSSVLGLPAEDVSQGEEVNNNFRNMQPIAYELSNDLAVQTAEGQSLVLAAGTEVNVLETMVDSSGQEMVRLGLEYAEETGAPQDIWVSANQFAAAELSVIDDVDPYDEDGNEIDLLTATRKKMTYCYRYVKKYLLAHGMVDVYLPGGSAYMAATELPKHGFKKTSRKPSNAIVNDVCVYRGGPSGHGHIEILTKQGWYYGYGYKKSPIKNRIFIGCYHK